MLINNLHQHRQKYSSPFFTSPARSTNYSSNPKIIYQQSKIQNECALKSKLGSQKKFKTERLTHFYQNPTYKIASEDGFFDSVMSKRLKNEDHHGRDQKKNCVKTCQNFKQSNTDSVIETAQQKLNTRQKVQKKLERKPTKKKIGVPFCEESESQQKLSTKQQTGSKFHATTKPNTRTEIMSTPSQTTIKSNYKSILLHKQRTKEEIERQEELIEGLKINDVFFCRDCYRYIFGIEKSYHYPTCKQPFPKNLSVHDKYRAGLERLALLVELAEYTKYKPELLRNLYKQIAQGRIKAESESDTESERRFYSLIEIQKAARVIVANLIAEYSLRRNSNFCNNLNCDVSSQLD